MKRMVNGNNAEMYSRLEQHLGASKPYTLNIQTPKGIGVAFSQIRLEGEDTYTGTYYHNYPISLVALPEDGQKCYGFLVNGEEVRTEELLLDERYTADQLHIELITTP